MFSCRVFMYATALSHMYQMHACTLVGYAEGCQFVCRIKDVCDGQKQIPFMKENETGKWLYDSDKMVPYLEDKYPDLKKTGKPDECPQV